MRNDDDVFLIGTDDGTLFRCFTRSAGPRREPRWIFQSRVAEYLGPTARVAMTLDEVEALVQHWWHETRNLGPGHG